MTLQSLIIFLIVGAIAGWLAGLIIRGSGFGIIGNIIIGIIGAVIGGFLFGFFGIRTGGFFGSLVAAVIGAAILLFIIKLIKRV